LELAIGILISGVVLSAAFSLYLAQNKQWIVQNEISDMQSNIRAATSELANQIRMAGYGLPLGIQAIQARNSDPDSITITYASDELSGVQTEYPMPDPFAGLQCDGHDLSNIQPNDWVYIFDPTMQMGEYLLVTDVDYASSIILHTTAQLSQIYPARSLILKIKNFKYYIDVSDTSHPNLMFQKDNEPPQIYAENIIDLQFKYCLSSLVVVDAPIVDDMIREVMISVTARANQPDPTFMNQYRTRTLPVKVKVRNLGVN